jgi:hypothetical protein
MEEEDCPGALCQTFFDGRKVQTPFTVVPQIIRRGADPLKLCKEFEQGIAWTRNKNALARVAEKFEKERIRFARSGSKNNMLRVNRNRLTSVPIGYGLPGNPKSFGIRAINERLVVQERRKDIITLAIQAALGGI